MSANTQNRGATAAEFGVDSGFALNAATNPFRTTHSGAAGA